MLMGLTRGEVDMNEDFGALRDMSRMFCWRAAAEKRLCEDGVS